MYTDFYKLKSKPFQISSDPSFIWLGEKHKEALATLKYSVIDNKGLMLLTGDVGTGKTTLINTLLESLGNDVYYASVPDPRLDLIDFLNYIAQAFHIDNDFKSKGSFLTHFGWFLETVYKQNKKALLIIDEAQLLTQDLLEEVRLLSNINRDGNHLLNIFFVGQNEFNEILHRPENRAVTQRITLNYQINPLSLEETKRYIRHRLKVAGASRSLFSTSAIKAISVHSEGIPRRINVICDHCLLTGYIEEKSKIDEKIVEDCLKDIAIPHYNKVSQSGKNDDKEQTQVGKNELSRLKRQRIALFLLSILMLSVIVAPLINFSPQVSGKLVSTYQSAVTYLWSKFGTTPVDQQQGAEGALAIQNETLSSGETAPEETTAISTNEKETTRTDHQASLVNTDSMAPDDHAEGNAAGEAELNATGDTTVPDLPVSSTPIVAGGTIDESESSINKTEKIKEEETIVFKTISNLQDQPEPAYPTPVTGRPVVRQDSHSLELSEIKVVESASEPREEKVIVRFENNSNDFSTSNLDQLIKLGLSIKNRKTVSLNISGYTDSAGPEEYNNRLSLIRANMVKSYLLGLGIHPDRMNVQGLGSQNPIADNKTAAGRRLNRRVEVDMVSP
jgi:type II secretory pathway predicted ATPase ExeA/outer membrane protein OmpA-like peptidoglycan-associated protein